MLITTDVISFSLSFFLKLENLTMCFILNSLSNFIAFCFVLAYILSANLLFKTFKKILTG